MMKKMKFVFMLMMVSLFFTGCNNDDGYSVGDMAVDWVTVKVEDEHVYSFVGDTWGSMWSVTWPVPSYKPKNGDRAFMFFNPLSDDYASYDHAIKPEYIYPVLTKEVENMDASNADEYGDDPVRITDAWISGGYMNLIFNQKIPVNKAHRVSLVHNTEKSFDDDYIHLEYHYNTYGDTISNRQVTGAVCYNLSALELQGKKGIKMRINSAVNGERILSFNARIEGKPQDEKNIDLSSSVNVK